MFNPKRKGEILGLIRRRKGKRVFIQVPEGLKTGVFELVDFLEKEGVHTFLSIEPCFGACDLRDREAKMLGCDLLLHLGHKDFGLKSEVPVVYYEYPVGLDLVPLVREFLGKIKFRKLCLVTTVQFIGGLEAIKAVMEKRGLRVYLGGEILGCNVSNAKRYENLVDAFLFIGSGRFHPLGLQEKTDKPVLFLDIERHRLEDLSEEMDRMEVKRGMRIEKAGGMENFGVLVSTKMGQLHLKEAEKVKEDLYKLGKKVRMLVCDMLTPEKLLGLKIDVIVNTACPRISEDSGKFGRVILEPRDVEKL